MTVSNHVFTHESRDYIANESRDYITHKPRDYITNESRDYITHKSRDYITNEQKASWELFRLPAGGSSRSAFHIYISIENENKTIISNKNLVLKHLLEITILQNHIWRVKFT